MYLVGTDGGLLDKPYPVTELLLSPGERVDLLVKADQTSGIVQVAVAALQPGDDDALQQVTLMTLTYSGAKQSQSLPAVVDPSAKRVQMDLAGLPHKQITLTMTMGGMGGGGMGGGGMGGGAWAAAPSASTASPTSTTSTATRRCPTSGPGRSGRS